jgi:hypothetical protein
MPGAPRTRIVRVAETLLCGGGDFSRGAFDRNMALFFGDYATAVHSPNLRGGRGAQHSRARLTTS